MISTCGAVDYCRVGPPWRAIYARRSACWATASSPRTPCFATVASVFSLPAQIVIKAEADPTRYLGHVCSWRSRTDTELRFSVICAIVAIGVRFEGASWLPATSAVRKTGGRASIDAADPDRWPGRSTLDPNRLNLRPDPVCVRILSSNRIALRGTTIAAERADHVRFGEALRVSKVCPSALWIG